MEDGMNVEETREVYKIWDQCISLNHKQTYSLINMLVKSLRRMIDSFVDKK